MTHQYPANYTLDSVTEGRVKALASFGFTERQCQFLVAVMVHAGCFPERQYCAFTGTVRGQSSATSSADSCRVGSPAPSSPDQCDADASTTHTTALFTRRSDKATTGTDGY